MKDNKIFFFDTTLRDGGQMHGIDFSVSDKNFISEALDEFGIDYIEGGWPGSNPVDDGFFSNYTKFKNSKLVAFGMTRKSGRSADNDPGLNAVLDSNKNSVCLVGKTWDFHVLKALNVDLDENLKMIKDSISLSNNKSFETMFDCEHFFDGFKSNEKYTLSCVSAAIEGGADWIILCDTNGGAFPEEVYDIVKKTISFFPTVKFGIHCHNDGGVAVANTLAAVKAGVRQVQGTLNGLGERCGNADLVTLIPNLIHKLGYESNIPITKMSKLTALSKMLDDRLNRNSNPHAPFVGDAAFSHKGGLHASAAKKDPRTYEHIDPKLVGNQRNYLISLQTGKSNILARFNEIGLKVDSKDKRIDKLIEEIKTKESLGWAFDSADASFELLARRLLGQVPVFFEIGRFRVMDERRFNAKGELVIESEAIASIKVGEKNYHEVAVGNGPVNAVDSAFKKALVSVYPSLINIELIDYKVRILPSEKEDTGTAAKIRVLIEFSDNKKLKWRTVGVSSNIIDASVMALSDGFSWCLLHEKN